VQEQQACVEQLEKLKGYREDYIAQFKIKGKSGMSASRLHEYQVFVQKIDKAIEEQTQAVKAAELKTDSHQKNFKQTNSRKKVVEKLIDKNIRQESKKEQKSEQNIADERPSNGGSMNDVLMWRLT
jgi:flagellar FliJ protein